MSTIPQYAKSTDPSVIATIERNRAARAEFSAKVRAWVLEHAPQSEGNGWLNGWGDELRLVAVAGPKPMTGRWKRRGHGWEPYVSNPLHAQMAQLTLTLEPVPGVGESYAGEFNSDGAHPVYSPVFFVHDGAAYFRLAGPPAGDQEHRAFGSTVFDHGLWEEILTSQWYAAYEARQVPA
jgi:hypothetical protein